MRNALAVDEMITHHAAIMDKYDPRRRVALIVGEWGMWHDQEPGSRPGFLYQQNSMRDAVVAAASLDIFNKHADRVRGANIAQMVNVLQAMILTDKDKMLLTPSYHVFRMYVPFQDASVVPVAFDAGSYTQGDIRLPRVDALAAKDAAGKLWLAITNLDPAQPVEVELRAGDRPAKAASGETLTATRVDSVNSFDAPRTVAPKPIAARAEGGALRLALEPKSVTVVAVEP
jgi:alpha-N-arabinofuranosidase